MTAIAPDVAMWDAWRPSEVAALLAGVDLPWCVAAGWAIDLFIGQERREHADLEIAVPHVRFGELVPALEGFEIFVITAPGEATPLAAARHRLADTHQTWIRDPGTGHWRLDVFREPSDGETWICRRDASIRMAYDELIERTDDGIPYARPEVVLLFKAKHADEPKNDADLEAALPRLDRSRRRWLSSALERVHPGHRWLSKL